MYIVTLYFKRSSSAKQVCVHERKGIALYCIFIELWISTECCGVLDYNPPSTLSVPGHG